MADTQTNTKQHDAGHGPADEALQQSAVVSHRTVLQLVNLQPTHSGKLILRRMEKSGHFPRRMYLSPRRPVWRRADVLAYLDDPENWRSKAS